MAEDDPSPRDFDNRRIVVRTPTVVGIFYDLCSRYLRVSKKDLFLEIWNAGMVATFGISTEEIEERGVAFPPKGTRPVKDRMAIKELLCPPRKTPK